MTMAHARALLPGDPIVEAHELERDERALERLAVWASRRFSPMVAPEPPDALLLDVSGCARLFKGEQRLLRGVLSAVTKLGFSCRGCIAPTYLGAWGLARFADRACVVVESRVNLRAAMSPLPVTALGLSRGAIDGLAEVGITAVGQVLELPRSSMPSRFGDELLNALDRAMGDALETIVPVRPVAPPRFDLLFDGPTTNHESMTLAVRRALDSIAESLARSECGARRIDLELLRAGLPPEPITIQLSRPSRDAKHLWKLAEPKLDRVNMGDGIEGVRAVAHRVTRLAHRQLIAAGSQRLASESGEDDAALAGALDALAARLGADSVLRMEPVATHLPERSSRMIAVMDAPPRKHLDLSAAPNGACRPSVLFDTPRPARVSLMTPEGPLLVIDGDTVRCCAGPERIEPEWWRASGRAFSGTREARDYYRVQCADGRWLWVYRGCASGKWFIHGQWA